MQIRDKYDDATSKSVGTEKRKNWKNEPYVLVVQEHTVHRLIECGNGSVPDPWQFGVDPYPDPRIHASN
jgi:hypothetical protein